MKYNKRHFLWLLLLPGFSVSAQERPNILWITIEDSSPQFFGCYGNKDANTPVIDKLAKQGVRFTNAFSTGTVCSPSRTAIITGVKTYQIGTGNHRSKYTIPDFIKGFPYYLQQAGYYTTNNKKTDYNVANEDLFIKEAWDESSAKAGWWNRKTGQPFFAVFNFMDSHQSRTMTNSYDWYLKHVWANLYEQERIGDNEFEMPPFYNDSPEMRKQFARVYNSIKLTDNKIGKLLEKLQQDHLADSTIIFFYADHGEGMPRGKTNGINFGYRVPFIIWFPEMYKHLSPWGTGGVVTNELIDFTDLAPTLIGLAGGKIPEYMLGRQFIGKGRSTPSDFLFLSSDRSDNGIDMVRTVTNGKYVYSRNFMPFMPEARFIRYMEIGEIKQQMRKDLENNKLNDLQKSLFEKRPAEFLFNIENDLWETKNLVNEPEYQELLKDMRRKLKAEVLQSRDVMFLPEYEIRLMQGKTNAYDFRSNDGNYPISKIYDAASLSGFRGRDIAAKQIEHLQDKNEIVRYWGIMGLRCQSSEVLAFYRSEILKAMQDTYPPVAVAASAIAFNEFNNPSAEKSIQNYCSCNNMDLALMAINFLLYTENKEPFIETIRAVRKNKNSNYNVKAASADFLGSLGLIPNNTDYSE